SAPRQSLVTGRHFDLLAEGEHGGDSCWLGGQRKAQVKYKIDVSRMALPRRSRSRATTFAPLPPGRAALPRAEVQACGQGGGGQRSPANPPQKGVCRRSQVRLPPAAFAPYGAVPWIREAAMVRVTALACALLCAVALSAGLVIPAQAQQASAPAAAAPPQPPYGPPITLDQAKRVMAAAALEAAKNSWTRANTIPHSGANKVMFH